MIMQGHVPQLQGIRILGQPVDAVYDTRRGYWMLAITTEPFAIDKKVFLGGRVSHQIEWTTQAFSWVFGTALKATEFAIEHADKDDPVIPYDREDQEDENGH